MSEMTTTYVFDLLRELKDLKERFERLEKYVIGPNANGTYKCLMGYAVAHKRPCKCK